MDYEAIDRDMSSWVVTRRNRDGVREWLAGPTDFEDSMWELTDANRWRFQDEAEKAAANANKRVSTLEEPWKAIMVPEAVILTHSERD